MNDLDGSNFLIDKDNGVGDFSSPMIDVLFELDEYFVSMKLWPIKIENGCRVVDDQHMSEFLLELDDNEKVVCLQIQDISNNISININKCDEEIFGDEKEVYNVFVRSGAQVLEELKHYNSDKDLLDEFHLGIDLLNNMRNALELLCPHKGLFNEMVRYNISVDSRIGDICFEDIFEDKDFTFKLLNDNEE